MEHDNRIDRMWLERGIRYNEQNTKCFKCTYNHAAQPTSG